MPHTRDGLEGSGSDQEATAPSDSDWKTCRMHTIMLSFHDPRVLPTLADLGLNRTSCAG